MVDMAHIAGLVAGGVHPSPVPHADFVTTTTHKTLRGPRGGMVLCREKYAKDLDRTVFPGVQGGPLMHIIAAKAVCFKEARDAEFAAYQRQLVENAARLAAALTAAGFRIVSGGTDNHLVLRRRVLEGHHRQGRREAALGDAGITVNKNAIPFDQNPPMVASGIRLGTPAVTTRGMGEPEMDLIAELHRSRARGAGRRRRAGRWSRQKSKRCAGSSRSTRNAWPEGRGRRGVRGRRAAGAGGRAVRAAPRASARWPRQSPTRSTTAAILLAEAGTGTGKTLAYLVPGDPQPASAC